VGAAICVNLDSNTADVEDDGIEGQAPEGPSLGGVSGGRSDAVNAKKAIILVGVALVLFYVITQPAQAALAVQGILGWLRDGAEALITFMRNLFA
jgi:hypothetical protein